MIHRLLRRRKGVEEGKKLYICRLRSEVWFLVVVYYGYLLFVPGPIVTQMSYRPFCLFLKSTSRYLRDYTPFHLTWVHPSILPSRFRRSWFYEDTTLDFLLNRSRSSPTLYTFRSPYKTLSGLSIRSKRIESADRVRETGGACTHTVSLKALTKI